MTTSRYRALDDSRSFGTAGLDRMVLEEHGAIEPHIDELDSYCSMPIRMTLNAGGASNVISLESQLSGF